MTLFPRFCRPAVLVLLPLLPLLPLLSAVAQPTTPPVPSPASPASPPPAAASVAAAPAPAVLKDGKLFLNADGSRYFKTTLIAQVWGRYNQSNPGTRVNGFDKADTYDVGIRRFRIQLYSQLTDRVFIYSQIGLNNFGYLSERKLGFFLHDAVVEYAVVKTRLSLGAGLGAWNGLSRFTASAVGSVMGVDLPLVEETTNDVDDQFGRKLSLHAKGKLGQLDYRLALSNPLIIAPGVALKTYATFSSRPPQPQYQGYFSWQFLDPESNLIPYNTGTYLGKKKVFNVGAGFIVQPQATWSRSTPTSPDTLAHAMQQYAVDVYYDAPTGPAPDAPSISFYAAALHLDYGPDYLRYLGPLNPANGLSPRTTNQIGGAGSTYGNALPLFGTGNVLYAQAGYKFKDNLLGTTTFMPYASYQYANYSRLANRFHYFDLGASWLLAGHGAKLTASYQNRPVFVTNAAGDNVADSRRSAVVLQYQVYVN